MNAEIQFISVSDYIASTDSSELNFSDSLNILKKVAKQNENGKFKDMLVDVRDFVSVLTMPEIYEIINELSNNREQFSRKIAVLYGTQFNAEKIRFFEMSAQNRGFILKAFFDYDDAFSWLTNSNSN